MYPYFLVLLTIIFLSLINIPCRKHLIFLILFIFSAIRFDIGFDFNTYYDVISDYTHSEYDRFGVVDRSLIDISRFLGVEQFYFIITSLIINYFIFKTLLKYSANFFISAIIYFVVPIFYLYSFSVIRQFVAIALVFYAVAYVFERKPFYFILFIAIASLFHVSALVALPIYFFRSKRFSNVILLSMLIGVILAPTFLKEVIGQHLPYYSHYLESEAGHGWMMMYLLLIFFAFIIVRNKKISGERGALFYNSYVFGLFLYCFFVQFGDIAPRISFYYLIFLTLLIPEVLIGYKAKQVMPLVCFFFAILFSVNFYFFDKNSYKNPYLPYQYFGEIDAKHYIWK